ncbi:hypothetical protein ALT717_60106 [Alteromonas macleodii]
MIKERNYLINFLLKWVRHPPQEKALAILKSHIDENWERYIDKYLPVNKFGYSYSNRL